MPKNYLKYGKTFNQTKQASLSNCIWFNALEESLSFPLKKLKGCSISDEFWDGIPHDRTPMSDTIFSEFTMISNLEEDIHSIFSLLWVPSRAVNCSGKLLLYSWYIIEASLRV